MSFRYTNGNAQIHWSQWDSTGLKTLFEPEKGSDISHLPISEQLRYYKKPNLLKTKLFNISRRCWGANAPNIVRTRAALARDDLPSQTEDSKLKQIQSGSSHDICEDHIREFVDQNSSENFSINRQSVQHQNVAQKSISNFNVEIEQAKREENYQKWIKNRMQLRKDIDNIVNYEEMARRPDKTPLQALVAQRFMEWKFPTHAANTPRRKLTKAESDSEEELPTIERPIPELYNSLEQYLKLNSLRWVDLFAKIDREKSWELDSDNIKNLLDDIGARVSKSEVHDFVSFFDERGKGKLSYKDLMSKRNALSANEKRKRITGFNSRKRDNDVRKPRLNHRKLILDTNCKSRQSNNEFLETENSEGIKSYQNDKPRKGSKKTECATIGDKNVAVFAAYEDDPNLYKMELLTLKNIHSRTSKNSHRKSIQSVKLSVFSNDSNRQANRKITTQKDHEEVEKREKVLRPLYQKLPKKLQPVSKTSYENTGKLKVISDSKLASENWPFYPGNVETTSNMEKNTQKVKLEKLESKRYREVTFTSLNSEAANNNDVHLAFRKRCWEDFNKIKVMFEEKGIIMSEKALERALLYPREKTEAQLNRIVKIPRRQEIPAELQATKQTTINLDDSQDSLVLPKKSQSQTSELKTESNVDLNSASKLGHYYTPKTASDIESEDYRLTKPKRLGQHFNPYYLYPKQKRPSSFGGVEELSTGTKLIKPKTDCWMTFDEYVQFCKGLNTRDQFISAPNKDAFWPGYMLDKLALAFTGKEKTSDSIFQTISNDYH